MEKSDFCAKIEKRIRKYLRVNEIFKKDDIIFTKDGLSRHLIENIVGSLPKKFANNSKDANKTIIKFTLDDVCSEFLENLMFNKPKKKSKGISILKAITDKEALLFARYNNIKFSPNKKNKKVKDILDKLEQLYPQTRYSLAKSIESLK
jgi:serine/threonine protein kinase